jgi:hypothetical protein
MSVTSYSPVSYDFREMIAEDILKKRSGKVFYFDQDDKVESVEGAIVALEERPDEGLFIALEPKSFIRIDRIITLFGKPGAAYDEYDSFGNQCLACTGGYDL